MHPEIQKAVEAGKLSKSTAEALDRLSEGTCVLHKSWGFGRISGVDFLISQISIDFTTKRGHTMQLQYAAESLQIIAQDHILAQIADNLEDVRTRATADPAAFVAGVLKSYNGRMTPDQLGQILVPRVFKEEEFKKWWDNAKKLLKKDGHFTLPSKRTDPIVYREESVSRSDEHLSSLRQARQLKDQISCIERIIRDLSEFNNPLEQLQPVVALAEDSARKNAKLATAEALTLLALRDDLIERVKALSAGASAPTIEAILTEEQRNLSTLLEQVPAAKLRHILSALPAAFGDDWSSKALGLIARGSTRVVAEAARLLNEKDKSAELGKALDRSIRDHSISSAALTWLCDKKERKGQFKEQALHPRVMSAILSALERDQFNENRDRKLHDLLMNDQELLPDLITGAELEEVREALRKLMLSPVFEDLNKRSLLGRFVRAYPELEAIISGEKAEAAATEREEKAEGLIVSWESLQKRQAEYEDLVTKKIPKNSADINEAASHGDLKENAEFKAAKETQRMLGRRRADLEYELSIARGTDFANPDTGQVSIGTSVTLLNENDGTQVTYHILGAWDSDLDKGIISYKTAVAQVLIGHKVGDEVTLPTDSGEQKLRIQSISAWFKN